MASDRADRTRFVGAVRASFTHQQRISKVGYVGEEVHRLSCPEYQQAKCWPEEGRETIAVGNLDLVFLVLLDDYVDGLIAFPPLHSCLRSDPDSSLTPRNSSTSVVPVAARVRTEPRRTR